MNEYIKAIYEIVVANNKFLNEIEKRLTSLENVMTIEPPLREPVEGEDSTKKKQ